MKNRLKRFLIGMMTTLTMLFSNYAGYYVYAEDDGIDLEENEIVLLSGEDRPDENDYRDIIIDEEEFEKLSQIRQTIIELAYDEMGYEEVGSNNWNKYADELNKAGWTCAQNEPWCAIFVAWLVYKAGVPRENWPTYFASTNNSIVWFRNRDRWFDKVNYQWSNKITSGGGGIDNYTPQPGDFVAIEDDDNKNNGPDHTGVIFSVNEEEGIIVTIEGNYNDMVDCHEYYWNSSSSTYKEFSNKWIVGVAKPDYGDDSGPVAYIDVAEGGAGCFHVSGWVYDSADTSRTVELHAYLVNLSTGEDIEGYNGIVANKKREDVDKRYGCGAYHGFDATIKTDVRGKVGVQLFAINAGNWDYNPMINENGESKIITISNPILITGIKLNKTNTTLAVGKTETLTATITPSNATNKTLSWSSSNTSIATVNSSGVVTAKAGGTATITAKANDGSGCSATCKVTVSVPISKIELNKTSTTIAVGKTETLTATITPSNATNKTLTWSSSNTSIATVNSSGVVTAKAGGTAIITAKVNDGSGCSATCKVTVSVPITKIELNKTTTTIAVRKTETLTATITPSNATNKTLTWSSSNTSIATVNSSGVVTAKAGGTATITAKANDGSGCSATCKVTVSVPITKIELNKTSTTIAVGKTETLTATITPSNATNKTLTWSSSNTSIASVNSSGVVTAKAAGTATITAKANDGSGCSATCSITVNVPVTGVKLNISNTTLTVAKSETLTATISPSNATNKSVTWSSSNSSIASVANGVVSAKAPGTATITVKTVEGGFTATCTVKVDDSITPVIVLNKTKTTIALGQKETLIAKVTPDSESGKSLTWSSSNTSVATVTSSGEVMAKSVGTTTITVKADYGSCTASCEVMVINGAVVAVDNVTTIAGAQVEVPVSISNNPGIAGAALTVKYDKNIFALSEIKAGRVFSEGTFATRTEIGLVQWYYAGANGVVKENGELFALVFDVKDSTEAGSYAISVELLNGDTANLTDQDGIDVPVSFTAGKISVTAGVKGDVTGDGQVAMSDVIKIARAVAGYITLTEQEKALADVTGDGRLAMGDVIKIARYVAGYIDSLIVKTSIQMTIETNASTNLSDIVSSDVQDIEGDIGRVTGTAEIEIASKNAKQGDVVEVPVEIKANPGIAAIALSIDYDTNALELIGINKGDVLSGGTFIADIDKKLVQWYDVSSNKDITDKGVMFTLEFVVKNETANGTYPIKLEYLNNDEANVTNIRLDNVRMHFSDGAVVVGTDEPQPVTKEDVVVGEWIVIPGKSVEIPVEIETGPWIIE